MEGGAKEKQVVLSVCMVLGALTQGAFSQTFKMTLFVMDKQ